MTIDPPEPRDLENESDNSENDDIFEEELYGDDNNPGAEEATDFTDMAEDEFIDDSDEVPDETDAETEKDKAENDPFTAPDIDDNASLLSSTPTKNILFIAILVIGAVILIYNIVFTSDKPKKKTVDNTESSEPVQEINRAEPTTNVDFNQINEPVLPMLDPIEEAPLPPPSVSDFNNIQVPNSFNLPGNIPAPPNTTNSLPFLPSDSSPPPSPAPSAQDIPILPPAPNVANQTIIEERADSGVSQDGAAAARRAKRTSAMILMNSGSEPRSPTDILLDSNGTLNYKDVKGTGAEQVTATKTGNLNYLIAQGKMISAVLETAINTDLPGSLRAIISRDIYAESGKNILIPKGSRLIGSYQSNVAKGQKRVFITWDRLILPSGIDMAISSPGTDKLGRTGVRGIVDNKFFELFQSSLLLSALSVGIASATEASSSMINKSSSTGADGTPVTSQSGSAKDFAILDAVEQIGDVSTKIVDQLLNVQPTITVDQGTLVNVFVNKDLIFPSNMGQSNLTIVN